MVIVFERKPAILACAAVTGPLENEVYSSPILIPLWMMNGFKKIRMKRTNGACTGSMPSSFKKGRCKKFRY